MSEESSFLRVFTPVSALCGSETKSEFLTPVSGKFTIHYWSVK